VQAYYDINQRTLDVPLLRKSGFDIQRHTFDLDFEQHRAFGQRHDVVWGAGFRAARDHTSGQLNISFSPDHRTLQTFDTFLQDEIEVVRRRVWLTLGTKFERNDFSGWQVEPSVKGLWSINARHSLWAAVSRAHRIPSRTDADYRIDLPTGMIQNGLPVVARMAGNPNLQSETLIGYESGYRAQLAKRLAIDLAVYRNRYNNLRTNEPGNPFVDAGGPQPWIILPITFGNLASGSTHGVEVDANLTVRPWWSLNGYYSHFQAVIHQAAASRDERVVKLLEGQVPRNTWNMNSTWRLPRRWEFSQSLYQVGKQPYGNIAAYYRWDARLAWRASEQIELSLNGQNLLDARHIEYAPAGDLFIATPVKRAVSVKMTWRF
jgi:iron complex outermembrane receptor protein